MGMTIVTEIDSSKRRLTDPHAAENERQWAMLTHLSGIAAAVGWLLLLTIPIVMWLIKKDESPFIDDHGKEAVNFQLSMLLYVILFGILTCGLAVAFFLVFNIVCCIIASLAANRAEFYRYPICIRFIP